jgi:predicted PolB exonuclease-like 3'-5' exonuclease
MKSLDQASRGAHNAGASMPEVTVVLDIETVKDMTVLPQDWDVNRWPPPIAWQVIAIGLLVATQSDGSYQIEKLTCGVGEERYLLEQFWAFFDRRQPLLVTWNGRCFDLPVLLHRAMLHNVQAKAWFAGNRTSSYGYRFSADDHCDLMDQLTNYGAAQKITLDLAAAALGFAGKAGVDGSQVEKLFDEGNLIEISEYCECDLLNLFGVFLKWAHLTGRIDATGLNQSLSHTAAFLSGAGAEKPHLARFLSASPVLVAAATLSAT